MTSLNAIEAIFKTDPVEEDAKVTETDMNLQQYWLFLLITVQTHNFLTFKSVDKFESVTIQFKAKQFFAIAIKSLLYKAISNFEFMHRILKCDYLGF